MKTIQLSDDTYEKLKKLAKEYFEQDNRITAMPFIFQIRVKERVYDTGMNGDHIALYDSDFDIIEDMESLRNQFDSVPEDCDSINDLIESHPDWIANNGLGETSYSFRNVYKNAFFTEKACVEHIEANHYHYNKPSDYLTHTFRNPEMELIVKLFKEIKDQTS